ncbi:glycosyltransferase [Flammeovirga sp. OC4]|uniref:glycosyltransferase n=1 Tax=Flammeovirga sp. OC4 TaxID=1382345 RepID=UPI0005C73FC6|nr:glycosyltransferase [Flammeovirga sp. OC4]
MQKIILASVLKPVDDTRVYEKFGKSLAKIKNTELVIFGTKSNDTSLYHLEENIRFEPYDINEKSTRKDAGRLFCALLKKEKPQHIIIHTIELLPFLIGYKIRHKNVKIYYDILENYPLNFTAQTYHKKYIKYLLALGAQLIEKFSFPFLNQIFLAEKAYLDEKSLPVSKTTVLENKYVPITSKPNTLTSNEKVITYCGTLSKAFGVLEFLNFVTVLSSCNSQLNFKFKIIGKAYEDDVVKIIHEYAQKYPIEIIGITSFVPHLKIVEEMQKSDFVALPYPTNASTKNCIPTKMYECMALEIPMIIQENSLWKSIVTPYQAGIFLDFNSFNKTELENKILQLDPYPNGYNKNALWKTEEHKLFKIIK